MLLLSSIYGLGSLISELGHILLGVHLLSLNLVAGRGAPTSILDFIKASSVQRLEGRMHALSVLRDPRKMATFVVRFGGGSAAPDIAESRLNGITAAVARTRLTFLLHDGLLTYQGWVGHMNCVPQVDSMTSVHMGWGHKSLVRVRLNSPGR